MYKTVSPSLSNARTVPKTAVLFASFYGNVVREYPENIFRPYPTKAELGVAPYIYNTFGHQKPPDYGTAGQREQTVSR